MKEIIFITTQGSKLKRKDNQIVAFQEKEKIASFPVNRIEKLFIFGNVEITTSAVSFLLSRNVDIFLLSQTGKLKGVITTPLKSNYNNRLKQFRAYFSEKNLHIAKFFVEKKINQIQKFTGQDLSDYLQMLKNTESYNQILGIEGNVSALFFDHFKEYLKDKDLGFERRQYNPPSDPVNALLSLTYSLFYSFLFSIALSKGYDPYVGFLHRKRGTHAAFVSDVMEAFRVDLTRFVGILFNSRFITAEDFNQENNAFYLKPGSLKKFLKIYHKNFIQDKDYKKQIEKIFLELEEIL